MTDIRSLIEELVDLGVSPIDAADIVVRAAIAGALRAPRKAPQSGAERQARYRQRQKIKYSSDPRMAAYERARDGARQALEAFNVRA